MKLHKSFWNIPFSLAPALVVVLMLINYLWSGKEGFNFLEELKSTFFVGIFTAILMYFNRYNLRGEPRGKSNKPGEKR